MLPSPQTLSLVGDSVGFDPDSGSVPFEYFVANTCTSIAIGLQGAVLPLVQLVPSAIKG